MSLDLLIEQSEFAFIADQNVVTESAKVSSKNGLTLVKGIIATELNKKNANGRRYSTESFRKALKTCESEGHFESKRLLCSADDHPKSTHVAPISASHVVTKAYIEKRAGKDHLMNDWLILPTTNGKNLQALIDAKVAIGTSIRGLGKVNESKDGEVEDYKFLGCDCVGNPSASTYATPDVYKVQTESVESNLTIESIQSLVEEKQMSLDLVKSIADFKAKYYLEGVAPDLTVNKDQVKSIVSEIVALEVAALREGVEITPEFTSMKEEVLGQLGESVEPAPKKLDESKLVAESQDLITKLQRKLGAEQAVASFLTRHNADLAESLESMKDTITSYNEVLDQVKEEVTDLLAGKTNDSDVLVLTKEQQGELAQEIKEHTTQLFSKLQEEAKEVILGLEEQLHKATTAGEVITEQFYATSWLAQSLASQLKKMVESAKKTKKFTYVKTLESARK